MRSAQQPFRIGLIVPSSNTTMESELPELLRRQQMNSGHRFTCHSTRLRLQHAAPEALQRGNDATEEAVDELCDARVDAILYACLMPLMVTGATASSARRLAWCAAVPPRRRRASRPWSAAPAR